MRKMPRRKARTCSQPGERTQPCGRYGRKAVPPGRTGQHAPDRDDSAGRLDPWGSAAVHQIGTNRLTPEALRCGKEGGPEAAEVRRWLRLPGCGWRQA
jgi:hypothetical protein